jgi:hypothetical protein
MFGQVVHQRLQHALQVPNALETAVTRDVLRLKGGPAVQLVKTHAIGVDSLRGQFRTPVRMTIDDDPAAVAGQTDREVWARTFVGAGLARMNLQK